MSERPGDPRRFAGLLSVLTTEDQKSHKIGMTQVAGIRGMFTLFPEMDVMQGGGHGRRALVEYMKSYIMPLLPETRPSEIRAALFDAAAEQSYLVGAMAYDDGCQGLGQRYLIQALRLAQEVGNRDLGAHVLAGMSDQANLLGYPTEAIKLARAGTATKPRSQACRANLMLLEARGLAAAGDGGSATKLLVAAEREFAGVRPEEEPEWARFMDGAYMFGETAIALQDARDPAGAREFAERSLAECAAQGRARRASLVTAAMAKVHSQEAQLDAAANDAAKVVEFAASINSSRARQAVRELYRQFSGFDSTPAVRDFQERAVNSGIIDMSPAQG